MTHFKVTFFISLMALTLSTFSTAQKVLTTESGKKIIVKPDGSWQYIDEDKMATADSLAKSEHKSTPISTNPNPVELFISKKTELTKQIFVNIQETQSKLLVSEKNIQILDSEIKLIKKSENANPAIVDELNQDLKQLKKEAKAHKKKLKHLDKKRKRLAKIDPQNTTIADLTLFERDTKVLFAQSQEKIDLKEPVLKAQNTYTFETDETDTTTNPPANNCVAQYNGKEKTSGKHRIDLASEYLFGYTHEKLESYFKEQDFLSCHVQISNLGGLNFLSLKITIQSKKAKDNYGSIDKGSIIRMQLINGEKLYIRNVGPSSGILEPYTGATIYNVIYSLDKEALNKLSSHEIDTIGIIWSSGFEEYEVYHMDVLQNQVACIKELVKNVN